MRVCVPTKTNEGLQSTPYGHFGSAPFFILCDTESDEVRAIDNKNQKHVHGECHPMTALDGEQVDAVMVGGIGARALERLNGIGIEVYQAAAGTVGENLEALQSGKLDKMSARHACQGHG